MENQLAFEHPFSFFRQRIGESIEEKEDVKFVYNLFMIRDLTELLSIPFFFFFLNTCVTTYIALHDSFPLFHV